MLETFKLKEFEKECVIKLPEGSAVVIDTRSVFLFVYYLILNVVWGCDGRQSWSVTGAF